MSTKHELPSRKRTYAPKRRTGCDTCKKRRLRCDETKPHCLMCQKGARKCTYEGVPQTWTFEISPDRKVQCQSREASPGLTYSPTATSYTADEQLALSFFLDKTGPWMAENGGPQHTHPFWKATLPRAFHHVPATRHLITAIGLLEATIGISDQLVVNARCLRIHYNYAMGIQNLLNPDLHPVDTAVGPFLAWLLEMLMLRNHQAEVHAKALESLSTVHASHSAELSRAEYEHAVSCVKRTRGLREQTHLEIPLQQVLAVRSRLYQKTTPEEILQAFESFYENFDMLSMTLEQIRAADLFLDAQAQAIHGNVYRSEAPTVIFTALQNLNYVSRVLLQIPAVQDEADLVTLDEGLDFVFSHLEDNLLRVLKKGSDQACLDALVHLTLRVINQHGPARWCAQNTESLSLALATAAERAVDVKRFAGGEPNAENPIRVMLQKFLQGGRVSSMTGFGASGIYRQRGREKDLEELYSSQSPDLSPQGQGCLRSFVT